MKTFIHLLFLIFASTFAISAQGRDIKMELKIVKGPFFVPVTNTVFNPLGPDFKSTGFAFVFLTESTIEMDLPRGLSMSLKSIQDSEHPSYFYSISDKGPKVRVGFEGERLSWLFGRSQNWNITIDKKGEAQFVDATPFSRMTDDQILSLAERTFDMTRAGGLGDAKVERKGALTTVTAQVYQLADDDDDPVAVGTATIQMKDNSNLRTVVIKASVEDRQ